MSPFPSPEALFRYRIVSAVDVLIAQGHGVDEAVCLVARSSASLSEPPRAVGPRTIYRWRTAYQSGGLGALEPTARARIEGSKVLAPELLDFLEDEREQDPRASIPELIARARCQGIVGAHTRIDRSTVWRAMRRKGLSTRSGPPTPEDTRRFAYPERMQLVMADFVHFRAGAGRLKRLAVYLLDDATRFGLDVEVTTGGERTEPVLHVLARMLRRWGRCDMVYVDHGPGFIASDLVHVLAQLAIPHVLGRTRYPQGRGKIERFNRSLRARLLRGLASPEVDPAPCALTWRLRHDLEQIYNHRPHEGLAGACPAERWNAGRPLRAVEDEELSRAFIVPLERTVTRDHVISVEGVHYEVPVGYARQRVTLARHLLENNALSLPGPDGIPVRLKPVDPAANAVAGRARGLVKAADADEAPQPPTASMLHFKQTLGPITAPDGGFAHPLPHEEEP